jgi:CDP-diacylglycerol---serine O-phosphatidyltransferase
VNDSTSNNLSLIPVLPSILTLGNAVCGFAAISCVLQSEGQGPSCYKAGLFILLAMIFDVLDGAVARWTRQTSAFGAQLDSLCDMVSFGMAPAVFLLYFPQPFPTPLLWCIAVCYMACAGMRLARFNVSSAERESGAWFCGLPTPAAAGVIASCMVIWPSLQNLNDQTFLPFQPAAEVGVRATIIVAPWAVLGLAFLMVSTIRYPHLVKQFRHGKRPILHIAQLMFVLVAIAAFHEYALPLIFLLYAVLSPLRATASTLRSQLIPISHIIPFSVEK